MEKKKERFKFLKNIAQRFKDLEPKQKKLIIIVSCIVLALIIISIITSIIFASIVGSAGKVAGNLNNKGFAVKVGNKAYISNSGITANEDGKYGLYEVTKDNEVKLVEEGDWIKSINYYKGYVYFLSINVAQDANGSYERKIVKMKPNGEKRQVLVEDMVTTSIDKSSLNVSDGWVYYINDEQKLEKIKTNGEKRQQISDERINGFQIANKYIYYTTVDDDFGKMKKDGSNREKIESGVVTFQVVGNDVYYTKSNKHLMKLDLANKESNIDEEVISQKISSFNVYEKTIYYSVCEDDENGNPVEHAIYKVKTNGKDKKKLIDLTYAGNTSICIVGKWIYYVDKIEDSPYDYAIYRVKTNGEDKTRVNI